MSNLFIYNFLWAKVGHMASVRFSKIWTIPVVEDGVLRKAQNLTFLPDAIHPAPFFFLVFFFWRIRAEQCHCGTSLSCLCYPHLSFPSNTKVKAYYYSGKFPLLKLRWFCTPLNLSNSLVWLLLCGTVSHYRHSYFYLGYLHSHELLKVKDFILHPCL